MDIITAIKNRRSITKLTNQAVSTDDIVQIIEAGTWAPSHKRTYPWRFRVFSEEDREQLQSAMINGFKEANHHLSKAELEQKLEKLSKKAYRAPTIIAVWCAAGRGEKNPPLWEDHAATAACCQNMLLAAEELGIGAIWRSGDMVYYKEVQKLMHTEDDKFEAEKGDHIMGFIYIGHIDNSAKWPERENPDLANFIQW